MRFFQIGKYVLGQIEDLPKIDRTPFQYFSCGIYQVVLLENVCPEILKIIALEFS